MPTRRFAIVPVVAVILKVISLILLALLALHVVFEVPQIIKYWNMQADPMSMQTPPTVSDKLDTIFGNAIYGNFQQLAYAALFWLMAEFGMAFREIEFNTRRALPAEMQEAVSVPWAPPTFEPGMDSETPAPTPPTAE
jgi:hypothetical protein